MTDDRLHLVHIQECIARVENYTAGGRREFLASTLIQDAVLRNLQTLAESTQRLSEFLKKNHPDIDWKGIAGFRNILVHGYLGVDLERVWEVIERHLPVLKATLQPPTRARRALKSRSKRKATGHKVPRKKRKK